MVLVEDTECPVCFLAYSRTERIPRMLHCQHTFCVPCLQALTRLAGCILTVCCPLCRWITCAPASLTLSGSLWVNTSIWDLLAQRGEDAEKLCKWPGVEVTQTSPSKRKTGWRTKVRRFLKNMQDIPHH
ncbi:RING finger protein 208-like [Hypomesus transpacificus]|uniref:RING finger protein 208-like n=1 Tax=Hypomesus transpacificus TaxID=137520 RepID=UPI001F081E8F|nr:RING finger protein 208-like [Hypomesus transpacificus]